MATAARTRYAVQRPRNDAYVGLLTISLLALLISCLLLYLDYAQYGASKPSYTPTLAKPAGSVNFPAGGEAAPMGGAPMGETPPMGGAPMNPMGGAPMNPMGGAPMPMGGGPGALGTGPMGNTPPK
jgi:hypothetical protein